MRDHGDDGEDVFFAEVVRRHPEFQAMYEKGRRAPNRDERDIMRFVLDHSPMLAREENAG